MRRIMVTPLTIDQILSNSGRNTFYEHVQYWWGIIMKIFLELADTNQSLAMCDAFGAAAGMWFTSRQECTPRMWGFRSTRRTSCSKETVQTRHSSQAAWVIRNTAWSPGQLLQSVLIHHVNLQLPTSCFYVKIGAGFWKLSCLEFRFIMVLVSKS